MADKTVVTICSARPNFVKVAPLARAMRSWAAARHIIVHTGQHYDRAMSDDFFDSLNIPAPDINLGIGPGSHAQQTAKMMMALEGVFLEYKPDCVVVVGDVNGTLAAAVVASKLNMKLAHVEAGLRSFDRTMPEEINRVVTDALADLLFTPSADGDANLLREGVPRKKIHLVGNIMIDTLVEQLPKAVAMDTHGKLGLPPRQFVFVTLHRPSNVDEQGPLKAIVDALLEVSRNLPVVFPVHPRTAGRLETFNLRRSLECDGKVKLLDPVGYHDSICLARHAAVVITDSGGLQEETSFLGTPCLTLRPNTERPVTITDGTNHLTTVERLAADTAQAAQRTGQPKVPPLWDGKTAQRIVDILRRTV